MCSFDNTEKILVNLKVIGRLLEGSKLHISDSYFEIDNTNSIYQGIIRWYKRDGRNNTLNLLKQLILSTSNEISRLIITETCRKDKEKNRDLLDTLDKLNITKENSVRIDNVSLLKTLGDDLNGSLKGLNNLKETYNSDVNFQSRIELLITSIKNQIEQINKFLSV